MRYSTVLIFLMALGFKLFQTTISITNNQFFILLIIAFLIIFFSVFTYLIYYNQFLDANNFNVNNEEQQLLALKKAEKYRREFLGNVSHELKTPIFNIQGYIETLIDGALYDKAVNIKYLKRTNKSIDRLIYIIQDLESISQLDAEQIKLDITAWNLSNLIDEIIDQFEIKSAKKRITIINKKESTDFLVLADKDKIAQVLYNLISNSIKYGKHGGTTTISSHQAKHKCLVSVQDNGIGIADKNIKRLFERFYRVDKSRSREQGGTGLGLAIVKHIIEAHNQKINVKSTIKKGTQFTFSIDCKKCKKD